MIPSVRHKFYAMSFSGISRSWSINVEAEALRGTFPSLSQNFAGGIDLLVVLYVRLTLLEKALREMHALLRILGPGNPQ